MKSIKAKIVLVVLVVNIIGGAVIMAGMNMAYQKNVELVKQASTNVSVQEDMQQQLFDDMAGNRNRAIVMVAVLAVAMSAALLLVLNTLVFKRVTKVIDDAMGVIGGRHEAAITIVHDDEMGEIERALEQFRVLFIDAVSQARDYPER